MAQPSAAGELNAVGLETALLEQWATEKTFQASIDNRRTHAPFIFLEGPPTANGKPGIHHVVARTYKDLVCRWKAMEGFVASGKVKGIGVSNFTEENLQHLIGVRPRIFVASACICAYAS